jgi:glycine amidinotransferase
MVKLAGGFRYPRFLVNGAQRQLDQFIRILEGEGIKIRRPDVIGGRSEFSTPDWASTGFCIACPRDGFLVAGDEIIETPMAWRSRYFEPYAYRSLFKEYFRQGARWSATPRPQLLDDLFEKDYVVPTNGEPMRYVINEWEPVFDAADMLRCGTHIFYQLSNVTNRAGIEWLRRHLEGRFELVEIKSRCLDPMHIDSSLMLLAPGKALVNPEYIDVDQLPDLLQSWDIITAPEPDPMTSSNMMAKLFSLCSKWIAINVLSLDEKRVVVEQSQKKMIGVLKDHGFEPIPCPFVNYLPFGGAFHCATLDIRRRGTQQNYF